MYFYKPSKVNVKNKKNEADYGEFSQKKFRSLIIYTLLHKVQKCHENRKNNT